MTGDPKIMQILFSDKENRTACDKKTLCMVKWVIHN